MILPFFWMVSTSIKTTGETLAIPPVWLPENWQWSNYETALTMAPFDQYFINSVIITLSSTIGEVITSILAAFAFSKLQFFGKNILFTILISTMMVPFELLMIPTYLTLSKMGMINSYWAMIIPFLASVFSVFLLKQNFEAVPKQLYYAAKVDGASDWRFLWQILVPMSKSSIVTVVILKMIGSWNSFMWPLMVTNETHLRPLPVGLQAFTTEAGTYFELLMAAATIVVLPMIIIYLFLQKYIIKGISNTGVKG
ncbi:ABC transporter permease subunit [Carnobacterium sp. PL17GRE32]|uniref:Carbohydrate ABC transporter permease n=2 Tax=Bacilli TaxID=91061 RepID=A0ABR5ZZH7_9LACT|nr:ABC transporter permease subunit [Carnobacterium sp. PL12RED10]KAF3302643.1 ABC transporter permease subunit [Carnobacterium sp. PL17RED31]KAF3304175.1 ABC transporter permease subunit [Carnobacterium sp. PL17GRE32]MBA5747144.1 carbohydrate ABC transporter permease [Aerococcus urinaeequi]MBA5829940.1 carbohydrate ABC transporter permease [Aerococcus urinaeequi]